MELGASSREDAFDRIENSSGKVMFGSKREREKDGGRPNQKINTLDF